MIKLFCVMALAFSTAASAGSFATCILDRMPSAQNNAAVYAVMQVCKQENQGGYAWVKQGEGLGWFSFNSGADCTAKKASGTPSQIAGYQIRKACNCLYEKPFLDGQTCSEQ